MDIFKLVGRVMVDSRDAQDSIAKTDSKALGMAKTLGKGITTAAKWGAALAGAAVAAGTAVFAAASKVAEAGDGIEKNSQKVGLSIKSYQQWDYVMNRCGTSIQDCTTGLKTLTNKLDDAKNGSKGATETFNQLGISVESLNGLSREDIFKKVVSGLQGVKDETKKAALASDLFGKSGQNLLPMFNLTEAETQELMDKCLELGGVMSDESVKASAAYIDALTNLKTAFSGFKNRLMADFLPGMTEVMDGVALIISGNMEDGKESVENGIDNIVTTMHEMAPQVMEVIEMVLQILIDNTPMLIDMGFQLAKSLLETLFDPENVYKTVYGAIDLLLSVTESISDAANSAEGQNAIDALGSAIARAIWDAIKKHFVRNREKFYEQQEESYGINSLFSQIRSDGKHASGLTYVPYDGYVAELHRGEMVVPANKANEMRSDSSNDNNEYLLRQILDCLKSSQTININNREFGRLVRGVQ